MADDRKRIRQRGFERPASAVPVETVAEDDLTPLPAAPPGPEAFSVLPMAAKVDALHHVQQEHAAGFERIWEVRHLGTEIKAQTQRLERLETIVAQDTRQVTELIAKVQHWGETSRKAFDKSLANAEEQIRVDGALVRILDKLSELVDEVKGFNGSVNDVRERVSVVETEIDRIAREQNRHAAALEILDTRIGIVERKHEDKALVATTEKAQVRRWVNTANGIKALVLGAVAAISYLIGSNL